MKHQDIQRIRVFYNKREQCHENVKNMLSKLNIKYSMLPTTGPYTLHIIKKDKNIRIALGPTNVKIALEDLLEQKLS